MSSSGSMGRYLSGACSSGPAAIEIHALGKRDYLKQHLVMSMGRPQRRLGRFSLVPRRFLILM